MEAANPTGPRSPPSRRNPLVVVVVGAGVAYAVFLVGLTALQDRLLYYPEAMHDATPALLRLPFRDLRFAASDGVRLHAWFLPAPDARGSVVVAHGNAGNISHRLFLVKPLQSLGLNVLLFDYRGYGKSEGTPGEEGLYRDAEAAAEALAREPEAAGKPVVYYGESLGGAVVTELAVRRAPAALVLQSSFTSLPDMAAAAFPWLPARWMVTARYASIEKVPRLACPVLVVHGERDSLVPFEMGRRLFEAVVHGRKALHRIPGADHNDVWDHDGSGIQRALAALLDPIAPRSAGEERSDESGRAAP